MVHDQKTWCRLRARPKMCYFLYYSPNPWFYYGKKIIVVQQYFVVINDYHIHVSRSVAYGSVSKNIVSILNHPEHLEIEVA